MPALKEICMFDNIYNEYRNAVYGNILRIVKDPVAAEDILQDVFLALWENKNELVMDSVGGWLFTVSFNKSVKFLHRIKRLPLLSPVELSHTLCVEENPVDEAHFEFRLKLIEDAVSNLSSRRREVFRLCRFEGKSAEEAAALLNISVQSVRDYLKQSNRQIKSYLITRNGELTILNAFLIDLLLTS